MGGVKPTGNQLFTFIIKILWTIKPPSDGKKTSDGRRFGSLRTVVRHVDTLRIKLRRQLAEEVVAQHHRHPAEHLHVDIAPLEDIVGIAAVAVQLTGKPFDGVMLGVGVENLPYTLAYMHRRRRGNYGVRPCSRGGTVATKKAWNNVLFYRYRGSPKPATGKTVHSHALANIDGPGIPGSGYTTSMSVLCGCLILCS